MKQNSGFTFITLSIILTVAALVFVATLPGIQTSLKASATSVTKMNSVLNTMRGYMAANGYLPCPADPTQAIGSSNYGVAAANSGSTNNCIGGTPAAAYADTTNHIAIGMVPVKTLGLSYADALDGYGRDITYAVDTNATATCWSSSSLTGAITVNDNGINYNTIAVLVSHGVDGYGAWLPLSGTSGTATRFDNGSTDTSQAANAQVATGGGLTANSTFVSFVRKAATSTFDDSIVYKSNLYTLNTLPTSAQAYPTVTPPSNGTYGSGQVLTFTITYASNVTVTGTPQLDLSAISGGSIGTGNAAYATYQSGSGTTTLTFSYTVQNTDSAPNGLTMKAWIDLNGGTLSGGSTCFTAPSLTGVLIGPTYYRTVTIDHTKVGSSDSSSFPMLFSGTYTYLKTVANGGTVTNANGYDITFTSDAAGHNLLPFERESWSATTGAVTFWVQVPTVSHTADTTIYLQYANPGITTDQSNKTGTWDSNFVGVWHLNQDPSGTAPQMTDSTSNGNSATSAGTWNSSQQVTGKIGGSLSFNGTDDQQEVTNNASLEPSGDMSFSVWMNGTQLPSVAGHSMMLCRKVNSVSSPAYQSYQFWWDKTGNILDFEWHNTSGTGFETKSTTALSAGTWYYVTYVKSGATGKLYVNGTDNTASSASMSGTILNSDSYFKLGFTANKIYGGLIDEVRLSSSARSADWINTEYNNQSSPDKATYGASGFYTVGAQTSR